MQNSNLIIVNKLAREGNNLSVINDGRPKVLDLILQEIKDAEIEDLENVDETSL